MYFIRNFTDIGCNQQKNHKYGFAEKYFFSSHGTTLAQNFHKLAQLCDLHGKSPMLKWVSWKIIHRQPLRIPYAALPQRNAGKKSPPPASRLRFRFSGRWTIEKETETAAAVRERRFLLYQQLCLHSGGCRPNCLHHQCVPHHFRQAGNGPHGRPACKTDPA